MFIDTLPAVASCDLKHFPSQLHNRLEANLKKIDQLLEQDQPFTWDNLMTPLDDLDDQLEKFWTPLAHLHAVVNTEALRQCYTSCLPKISAYETTIGHNKALYEALRSIDTQHLNAAQIKILKDSLYDFELAGVALPTEKKKRFEEIEARLSELANVFEMHILDATDAFSLHITEEKQLSGLPERARTTARQTAEAKQLEGWLLNLEFPCYYAVMTYADDRQLREIFYRAYLTRASEEGPNAGQFDNSLIMEEILALRDEKAKLLGFLNFAELSLATKMAESTDKVLAFLRDLTNRGLQQAKEEYKNLVTFAETSLQFKEVALWDLSYLSEKLCQQQHQISEEELRVYFPLDTVLSGMQEIVKTLYGITFEKVEKAETWHADASCYRILNEQQEICGYVYFDLFARPNKRGGAWMGSFQTRRRLADGQIQLPIATLTCNFAKPTKGKVATLSHEEVITLFHEFGHCLQHLLSKVDYYGASGVNGVEWDAVELPSQIFENWAWDEQSLQLLTRHIETAKPMSKEIYERLMASKNFQSAMALMRQLEFSLFDFRMHAEYKKETRHFIATILKEVRQMTRVVPVAPFDRFQNSFSHIFAGGYEAGYYSYKWAEVLSADAFSRFEEEGVLNPKTGRDFLHTILEVGSSIPAKEAFHAFRGRDARIDALLRQSGIM